MNTQPHWFLTKDGDRTILELYERHYSCRQYADGRARKLFCGPGEKVVLRTDSGDAGFIWRKFIDDCIDQRTGERQSGINCSFFRNESGILSSELIRQADAIADCLWPDCRHYTTVSAEKTRRKRDPGRCFRKAGWVPAGTTKGGLIVLERLNGVAQ